ncbi:MAG: hypothetical protein V1729_04760, partial [Candidatus Woesearchaeota archaeon]
NPIDLVVTGAQFYRRNFMDADSEEFRAEQEMLGEIFPRYLPKDDCLKTGGHLACSIHQIKPDILVLRYSSTPDEDPIKYRINGDISKDDSKTLVDLLKDPTLRDMIQRKDWATLKGKYPGITFYDNLPK